MKRLSISAGLIALMAVVSALHVWHLNDFTGQLAGLLTQAQEQVELENWEEAARLTRQVKDRWMEHESYLHITLRHADTDGETTDAIQISMDEALAFLEGDERQPAEYAAVNARLLGQLRLLAEAELPTLTNLL